MTHVTTPATSTNPDVCATAATASRVPDDDDTPTHPSLDERRHPGVSRENGRRAAMTVDDLCRLLEDLLAVLTRIANQLEHRQDQP